MITPAYKAQLVQLHKQQQWGGQGWKCLPDIMRLILQFKLHKPTILDYGAGEQTLKHWARWALPQAKVTSFDPGMPGIDTMPVSTWDIVACTDVMEHVEPQYVDATLDVLRMVTDKVTLFYIACTPAKTHLPDGRNAHLVIQPPQWWLEKIEARWGTTEVIKSNKLLICNAYPK